MFYLPFSLSSKICNLQAVTISMRSHECTTTKWQRCFSHNEATIFKQDPRLPLFCGTRHACVPLAMLWSGLYQWMALALRPYDLMTLWLYDPWHYGIVPLWPYGRSIVYVLLPWKTCTWVRRSTVYSTSCREPLPPIFVNEQVYCALYFHEYAIFRRWEGRSLKNLLGQTPRT